MADSKKYDGSQWEHSLRKLTTATDTITTLPAEIYSDGTNATVSLKGNMSQTGTPTPENPIMPQGTGERTANLFDGQLQQGYYAYVTGKYALADSYVCTHLIPCTENTTYTFRCINTGGGSKNYGYVFFDSAQNRIDSDYINELTKGDVVTHTATTPQNTAFLAINIAYGRRQASVVRPSDITDFMLNTGSTAKPYEPWGYKIPISSDGVTTNIYLGSTQTVRQIKKVVFTGNESGWTFGVSQFGKRFGYALTSPMESTIDMVRSVCSHVPLTYSGGTYSNPNTYTIGSNQVFNISLDASYTTLDQFLDWLKAQYANGTPVTVWYVLATEETAAVNEPLMKIGTYADTLSNATAIPTTEGANSITVDTTVQPSEFTATWTGWHDAEVKEKSENLFDINNAIIGVAWNTDLNNNRATVFLSCEPNTDYCFSSQTTGLDLIFICEKANSSSTAAIDNTGRTYSSPISFTTTSATHCIAIQFNKTNISMQDINNLNTMLNEGQTALPYEPYWK